MTTEEIRALIVEYFEWLDDNPQFQGVPIWRAPIPEHLRAVALAELRHRLLYGDGSVPPRGIINA